MANSLLLKQRQMGRMVTVNYAAWQTPCCSLVVWVFLLFLSFVGLLRRDCWMKDGKNERRWSE